MRIEGEVFGLLCPGGADGFIGCEASQGFEPPGEVVGGDEVGEMLPELIVAIVVAASRLSTPKKRRADGSARQA